MKSIVGLPAPSIFQTAAIVVVFVAGNEKVLPLKAAKEREGHWD